MKPSHMYDLHMRFCQNLKQLPHNGKVTSWTNVPVHLDNVMIHLDYVIIHLDNVMIHLDYVMIPVHLDNVMIRCSGTPG